jgi:hypothetical protein
MLTRALAHHSHTGTVASVHSAKRPCALVGSKLQQCMPPHPQQTLPLPTFLNKPHLCLSSPPNLTSAYLPHQTLPLPTLILECNEVKQTGLIDLASDMWSCIESVSGFVRNRQRCSDFLTMSVMSAYVTDLH